MIWTSKHYFSCRKRFGGPTRFYHVGLPCNLPSDKGGHRQCRPPFPRTYQVQQVQAGRTTGEFVCTSEGDRRALKEPFSGAQKGARKGTPSRSLKRSPGEALRSPFLVKKPKDSFSEPKKGAQKKNLFGKAKSRFRQPSYFLFGLSSSFALLLCSLAWDFSSCTCSPALHCFTPLTRYEKV